MKFNPGSVRIFRFTHYTFEEDEGTAYFHYAFDNTHSFTEQIVFPGAKLPLDPRRRADLHRVLRQLHLVAGISYYKAAVPPRILVETGALTENTAAFMEELYLHGLGEFAWRNGLDLAGRVRFPFSEAERLETGKRRRTEKIIVPVGGGKDSVVSIEVLKAAGKAVTLFSVGSPPAIREVAAQAGLPHICVTRRLDPRLFELNARGALNGHVPISAIIAFILAAAAVLYNFDTAVMSNERSANTGNMKRGDFEINHQYSKSLAFERQVSKQFESLLPGFRYFSLLRPLSELDIARLFSRSQKYHAVFSSCNANYKIHQSAQHEGKWCLQCPKCRFVFLSLAPFLTKQRLLAIFGKNLLDDATQQAGFDALIGRGSHKPFECVGEIEESLAAFFLIAKNPQWREDRIVRRFAKEVLPGLDNPEQLVQNALTPTRDHLVPEEFSNFLNAYRGRSSDEGLYEL
ncbi:MAG: endonuclease domain-containing protein [Gammaproteobacteria bacterium]|nr:endonuclease domain-containing protein [Gammaproteobacteria bacterium]